MPDLPIQQSQKELEYMAGLQRARADSRRTETSTQSDPVDNFEYDDIDPEDLEEVKINAPSQPSFPLFIFALALLKDFLADPAQPTIIGIIISWIATILFAIIAFFWCMGKVGFSMKRFVIKPLVLMIAVGLIPILGFLPEASIFILWIHFRERGHIGDILQVLEKLEESK